MLRMAKRTGKIFNFKWDGFTTVGVVVIAAVLLFAGYASVAALARDDNSNAASTYVPSTTAVEVTPIAAFIGDSYTQGAGAEPRTARWSTQLSKLMNWRERNFGLGGTGYLSVGEPEACAQDACPNYQRTVVDAIEGKPEIVVIAGGQNDLLEFAATPSLVQSAIDNVFSRVRAALPDALIIAVGPSSPGVVDGTVIGMDRSVQGAANAVGAQYVSLIEPNVVDPAQVLPDLLHVNNDGHSAIRERVASALVQADATPPR